MRKLGLKEALSIINSYAGKEFSATHEYGMTQSGNYGWHSDYSCEGKPVIRFVVDNAHQFSRIYDIRG